ncbi:6-hydroxy-D-nicotine oxidase [Variovorax sp. SRS16]|uniref:FAD-dependent oxidoreductase n=1 Tax=Variovorax sp. SRS16 TaxID=282217 RepID=UPI00131681F6|nr:FAD-binding protein [Variovorax sp. SRS16]VTU13459.1 6-hydroxy-D-nicotine oxidase [Variovorax sp. SRS16]
MDRRRLLQAAAAAPFFIPSTRGAAAAAGVPALRPRVRPGDADWPDPARWSELDRAVGGRLVKVESPLIASRSAAAASRDALFATLRNPWLLGDSVGLTQTLAWVDAWTSQPSAYAVAAASAIDVAAAVDFARRHRLRLVVKGGGHSYQGTSNAPDSLLVWTRAMNRIELHEGFVASGCADAPQPAVTVGAGAVWGPVYDAVTTRGGRYVQGGGCLTVGVAGLVQSGGFGSFSKGHGTAASNLLEAEVVTADGQVRIVNRCREPELFWGLKGGGGGSLGVVTRLTLRTHPLPDGFGTVNMRIAASSDAAYRRLVGLVVAHCRDHLVDPHWGEQIIFQPGNVLSVAMLFQGIGRGEASAIWQPFIDAVMAAPGDFRFEAAPFILGLDARRFWDPEHWRPPGVVVRDARPGAPASNMAWSGDVKDAGQVLNAYQSAWLPAALLREGNGTALAEALYRASRQWGFALHLNKGLAGAPTWALDATRDTATNPAVIDAFALMICASNAPPAYPGVPGHEPDTAAARSHARAVAAAMDPIRRLVPDAGAYVSESDYFQPDWARAFWGGNHPRLQAVKARHDPDGLFFVHHGVGSERWQDNGFTPVIE